MGRVIEVEQSSSKVEVADEMSAEDHLRMAAELFHARSEQLREVNRRLTVGTQTSEIPEIERQSLAISVQRRGSAAAIAENDTLRVLQRVEKFGS